MVTDAIDTYFSTDLQKFNKSYNHSKLIESILNADSSIDSVIITLKLQRRVVPVLGQNNIYTNTNSIKYRNPIKPGTLTSSYFYINNNGVQTLVKITDKPDDSPANDNGTGTLRLVNVATGIIISSNVGTINYGTGVVSITGITPTGIPGNVVDLRFTAGIQEAYYNLVVSRNEILVQDDTTLNEVGGLFAGTTLTINPVV